MEKLRALIVDDEQELAQMLSLRLRAAGVETRIAHDGRRALEVARAWSPDVVLTDVAMPELDGWQLCVALRAEPALRGATILAMTAWATADVERRAREAGADGLLLKPFDERRLADVLRRAVRAAPGFLRA